MVDRERPVISFTAPRRSNRGILPSPNKWGRLLTPTHILWTGYKIAVRAFSPFRRSRSWSALPQPSMQCAFAFFEVLSHCRVSFGHMSATLLEVVTGFLRCCFVLGTRMPQALFNEKPDPKSFYSRLRIPRTESARAFDRSP